MGLGVLESRSLDHVPGTTRYFDDPQHHAQVLTGSKSPASPASPESLHAGLKCDTSGPAPIILVPQPSDDPNDPLNWPLWKRDLITFTLSLTAIFATSLGPILAADTITISLLFRQNFTRVALLTGYFLLGCGAAAILFVPSSRVWGKRHAFIIGLVYLVGTSAWAGAIRHDYDSFVLARVLQGVGCAPWETLVNAAIGDLYFVHQRGVRMAFTNMAVFGGAFFTPIVVGEITYTMGWPWTFYFVATFCAVMLPAVILLCPETAYRRHAALNIDMAESDQTHKSSNNTIQPTASPGEEVADVADTAIPQRRRRYVDSLRVFSSRLVDTPFIKLLLRPLPLFLHPAFLWACLIQGTMIGWTVFIGVIMAALFQGSPFFWNELQVGHAYASASVGAILGFVISGLLADWSVKVMTRRNGGIYEPEFRIVLVAPMMILGCAGLYGFAITTGNLVGRHYHYVVPLVFFALEVAGMVIGAVASSLYIVDAYRDLAIEGFTCAIVFKNFFGFALTFYAYDWIVRSGPEKVIVAIASVQVVVCLTSIPMYIYGKRLRAFFHRHDMLAALRLR